MQTLRWTLDHLRIFPRTLFLLMHLRGLSALQGVSTQRGTMTPWTTQDGASCSSRERTGSSGRCSPLRRAPLWVWLLLGALVVPEAWSFLNEEQEEMLVELHNHFRGQVSPSASAMMPLVRPYKSSQISINKGREGNAARLSNKCQILYLISPFPPRVQIQNIKADTSINV